MDNMTRYILSVGFALGLVIVLLWYAGTEKILETLIHLNPFLLVPIILLYSIDWTLRGIRWKLILGASNFGISIGESTMLTLIGNMANIVVPAKMGDLARVYGTRDCIMFLFQWDYPLFFLIGYLISWPSY